jgi:hypothetical protein
MNEQPSLADLVPNLARASLRELHGPCPFCGGVDRFIVFEDGRGWCRQCGWKGDSIQLLRDRDRLSFVEAKRALGLDCSMPSLRQRHRVTAHRHALAAAKQAYADWQRKQLIALTDEYRSLNDRLEVATIAYRATQRRPDLYSDRESSSWAHELAVIYHQLPALEHGLDILTYRIHEAGRFAWWQEVSRG